MSLQLFCVNFGSFEDALRVVRHCLKVFPRFDRATIVHRDPRYVNDIETIQTSAQSQNEYWGRHRTEHVACDQIMNVQWDGFVIHPEKWEPEFQSYDYIGAPWRLANLPNKEWRVGSGGFAIQSRNILEAWSRVCSPFRNLDWEIGAVKRDEFEKLGFTFAPLDVACRFAKEDNLEDIDIAEDSTFGFHGFQYSSNYRKAYREMLL